MYLGKGFTCKLTREFMDLFLNNRSQTWDQCYDFKNIFAEKFSENIGIFCSNYS
jgi:hypothetical protein